MKAIELAQNSIKMFFTEPVRFKILYQTEKLSSFCSNKDPTPMYLKSYVIYKLTCPDLHAKTDRCYRVRLDEHSSDHNAAVYEHLHGCKAFKFLFSLNNLPECFNNKADAANFKSHVQQTILNNITITT